MMAVMTPAGIDPSRTALLVMDFQPAIVQMILAERAFPRQADVIESAELAGVIGPSDRD